LPHCDDGDDTRDEHRIFSGLEFADADPDKAVPSLYIGLAEIGGKVRVLANLSSFLDRRDEGIGVPVGNALLFIDSDQVRHRSIGCLSNVPLMIEFGTEVVPRLLDALALF